jgi:TolB-like protein
MSFLAELKRRNVIRVLIAYLAAAWFLIQIADTVVPAYGLPDSVVGILITLLAIGLVPVVITSWVFEWTPAGLKRDADVAPGESIAPQTGNTLDRIIMLVLALAVGFFAFDKFVLDPGRDAELAEQVRADTRIESFGNRSIAVLPFVNMSSDPEQVYFSDGVAEEILNLLARMKELRVISRSSAFVHRGEVNIQEVAKALNVSYVLEGSVRRSGDQVRVTAQLIDARTDSHVWSDTWDRGGHGYIRRTG